MAASFPSFGVQCFARGTLLSLTSPTAVDQSYQQYRSYEAGRQLGAGVGSLMAVLVEAWEAHHQRVVLEAKSAQKQIEAYLRANIALLDEQIALVKQDAENERQLQTLDPERREQLIQLEKGRVESAAELLKLREDIRSLECSYLQGKQSLKRLRYGLSARGGARWTYNLQRDELLKEYVLNRALAVVVASYLKKDVADPPRTTQSYENVCQQ